MTLRFLITNDLGLLYTDPGSQEPHYGFSFRIVAQDQEGRRYAHFYQETDLVDRVPARLWRLLRKIQKAKFTDLSQLSPTYWRETYPDPRSKAGREFAANMERIDRTEREQEATDLLHIARAQDERDNRHAEFARA